jgi:hypothetical protein
MYDEYFGGVLMFRFVRTASAVAVLSLFAVSLSALVAADEKLGKGVSLTEATPIKALYDAPDKFAGKTVRIDGVVSAVCAEMGCWMALADESQPELVVRFKVDHGTGIVFPTSAKGKKAAAEGLFEKIAATDAEGNEAAAEAAKAAGASDFGKTWHIKAVGAVIK